MCEQAALLKAEPQQRRGFLQVDSTIETETYCGTYKLRLWSTCGIGLVKDLYPVTDTLLSHVLTAKVV